MTFVIEVRSAGQLMVMREALRTVIRKQEEVEGLAYAGDTLKSLVELQRVLDTANRIGPGIEVIEEMRRDG